MFARSFVDRSGVCWYEVRCACGNKANKYEDAAKARGSARDMGFSELNECADCKPKKGM